MSEELDDYQVSNFVDEWLNHMNIPSEKDISSKLKESRLNYYLPLTSTGIVVSEWRKPFSVQALNKNLRLFNEFNLNELIIITRQISEHAMDTIHRLKVNVSIIHPFNLSDLAMKFVLASKFEEPITV